MMRMSEIHYLLLASFVLSSPWLSAEEPLRSRPEAVGLSAEKLKALDQRFVKAIQDNQIAGAVVLVARKGKIGHLEAIGMADIDAKKPMKPDALFRIASMTKAITSVAAMMLIEEGKLNLDDPVYKHLPEFKDAKVLVPGKSDKEDDYSLTPAKRPITIHDLLTHTSGLIYANPGSAKQLSALYSKAKINGGFTATTEKLADNVKRLGALPLAHQPGGSASPMGYRPMSLGELSKWCPARRSMSSFANASSSRWR
jgi:CubicO group peptidase (beta-lactamase class C family)